MSIKVNVCAAKAAGYVADESKPLMAQPHGVKLDAENVGDVCYIGPCADGTREVYYFSDGGCTDGPWYTAEGCD